MPSITFFFIPSTGCVKFATKFVTQRRKRRRTNKITHTLYIRELVTRFRDIDLKFSTCPFLPKKLRICRNLARILFQGSDTISVEIVCVMFRLTVFFFYYYQIVKFKSRFQLPTIYLVSLIFFE